MTGEMSNSDRPGGYPGPHDAYGPQDDVPGRGPGYGRPQYDDVQFGAPRGGRFNAFPFPNYTTRTRGGTQVSVGGCCLPIPLGCLALTLTAGGVAVTRLARHLR